MLLLIPRRFYHQHINSLFCKGNGHIWEPKQISVFYSPRISWTPSPVVKRTRNTEACIVCFIQNVSWYRSGTFIRGWTVILWIFFYCICPLSESNQTLSLNLFLYFLKLNTCPNLWDDSIHPFRWKQYKKKMVGEWIKKSNSKKMTF